MRPIRAWLQQLFSPRKALSAQLQHVLGFRPTHLPYYQTALIHRSAQEDPQENNERLEFLGDAILGAIVAEFLFKKYPGQAEGVLTEIRSRIVRRESMNELARKIGIPKIIQYSRADKGLRHSHIFGNALEALIGAIYLDKGFHFTRDYIIRQIIMPHVDLEFIETTDTNYKNQLLQWSQKKGHEIQFDTIFVDSDQSRPLISVAIMLNGKKLAMATGHNKKLAGQLAARQALETLKNTGEIPLDTKKDES